MSDFPMRIVHVDDDPDMRDIVKMSLMRAVDDEDFVIVSCPDGNELLTRIRELTPELIIMDLSMPKMDGPEMIKWLLKSPDYDNPSIIFLTGKEKVEMLDDYKRLGVIGVIHKPFSPKELPGKIRELWQTRPGAKSDSDDEDGEAAKEDSA